MLTLVASTCLLLVPPSVFQEKRDKKTSDGSGVTEDPGKDNLEGQVTYAISRRRSSYLDEQKHAAEKLRISTSIAV